MVVSVTSGIGIFFIVMSFIFSGALLSGDGMRANMATESAEGRNQRHHLSARTALIAIPNFVLALLFYYLF